MFLYFYSWVFPLRRGFYFALPQRMKVSLVPEIYARGTTLEIIYLAKDTPINSFGRVRRARIRVRGVRIS